MSIFCAGTTGKVLYSNLSPGNYRLRILAQRSKYDTVVVRRFITVPNSTYGCAVNLINEGFTLYEDTVTIQFAAVGVWEAYACFLDNQEVKDKCKDARDKSVKCIYHGC